jgi:hypothetical protein
VEGGSGGASRPRSAIARSPSAGGAGVRSSRFATATASASCTRSALRRRAAGRGIDPPPAAGPPTVADLRKRAELIVSWPVATHAEASELWSWGVDGVITEHFEALA